MRQIVQTYSIGALGAFTFFILLCRIVSENENIRQQQGGIIQILKSIKKQQVLIETKLVSLRQKMDETATTRKSIRPPPTLHSTDGTDGTDGTDATGGMWKNVQVFVGSHRYDKYRPRGPIWHSQSGQDHLVAKLLNYKKGGFFIDLAANEPVDISNTLALERDFGWRGLCIEGNPHWWFPLSHRKCDVVGAVISDNDDEEILFSKQNNGLAGIVNAEFDNHDVHAADTRHGVSFSTVLSRLRVPMKIDYLSLDVEGAEFAVMKNFPFGIYEIGVLTVERPSDKLKTLLRKHGYRFHTSSYNTHGDELWLGK